MRGMTLSLAVNMDPPPMHPILDFFFFFGGVWLYNVSLSLYSSSVFSSLVAFLALEAFASF